MKVEWSWKLICFLYTAKYWNGKRSVSERITKLNQKIGARLHFLFFERKCNWMENVANWLCNELFLSINMYQYTTRNYG